MIWEFLPKSIQCVRHDYSFSTFKKDLLAGLTVGIIALPLAMAFAIASGVEPERGLFTAIIAGFLISAFGGSRVQIGGPTGAFVVIIYDIIQRTGYQGLCASTLIASVLLLLLGFFRLGSWIKYIPHPLITGFTTGIAVLIFSTQVKDFFGLQMETPPADFVSKWDAYFHAFPTFDAMTLALGAGTLGMILIVRRFVPRLPWGITAIVLATLLCFLFKLPVATIQSRFGQIPSSLPWPSLSCFSIPTGGFNEIMLDGITIALLGAIESLLSAVIGDRMIGSRHRSNCELVAQGIANFSSILFGGIPATGAIARTAANVKTGAQTPIAGMIHAATLFLILYGFSAVVSQIPLAALAAVLMMVAWNMSEAHHFGQLLKAPIEDRIVLLSTFFCTVFVDITVAIFVGIVLASLLFMKRMSREAAIAQTASMYEMQGPLFFGTTELFTNLLESAPAELKVFTLSLRGVPLIDASGMHALKEFHERCRKKNVELHLSHVSERAAHDLAKFGLSELL